MCGFAVFLSAPTRGIQATDEAVEPMITCLAHSGPDQQGIWTSAEDGIALGFRRLAIVDLTQEGP